MQNEAVFFATRCKHGQTYCLNSCQSTLRDRLCESPALGFLWMTRLLLQACPKQYAIYGVRFRSQISPGYPDDIETHKGITGIEFACGDYSFCGPNMQDLPAPCRSPGRSNPQVTILHFTGLNQGAWSEWEFCPESSFAEELQLDFDYKETPRPITDQTPELKAFSLVCSDTGRTKIPAFKAIRAWWTSNDASCNDLEELQEGSPFAKVFIALYHFTV